MDTSTKAILVVDDNSDYLEMLRMYLLSRAVAMK